MCASLVGSDKARGTPAEKRPGVLSIAGFDPSAGAGILADIKTCEALEVYGFGACTALTAQNEASFKSINWVSAGGIIAQIESVLECHQFSFAKIGIIESLETLSLVLNFLKSLAPQCKIIWDPVLQSSSGFTFHAELDRSRFERLCSEVFLLTPNRLEIKTIYPDLPEEDGARKLGQHCAVLLKGGHASGDQAIDTLFWRGESYPIKGPRKEGLSKHGSGCVHSAALTSYLARGFDLVSASAAAREYAAEFLESGTGLLGYHQRTP